MTYDVVLLSYRRPENLPAIVAAIRQQRPEPGRVFIWHNAPSSVPIAGAVNVFAGENFKCRARHALGMLSTADALVFLDDDVLLVALEMCAALVAGVERHPGSVVGPEGRRCLAVSPEMYWGKDSRRFSHEEGPASIVKGKVHAVSRSLLHHAFAHDLPEGVWTEDDIVLCAEVQMATGKPAWIIEALRGMYRNLADEKGNEKRVDHFEKRAVACQHMAGLGWEPTLWKR